MIDEKGYVNFLHPSMWRQLPLDQRVRVLQEMENAYAGSHACSARCTN